jgi:hypothetical protein
MEAAFLTEHRLAGLFFVSEGAARHARLCEAGSAVDQRHRCRMGWQFIAMAVRRRCPDDLAPSWFLSARRRRLGHMADAGTYGIGHRAEWTCQRPWPLMSVTRNNETDGIRYVWQTTDRRPAAASFRLSRIRPGRR